MTPERHHLIGIPDPQRFMAIQRGYVIGFDQRLGVFVKQFILPDSEYYIRPGEPASKEEVAEWTSGLKAIGCDFFSRPCACPTCTGED